jgi:hypothetical protein
VGATSSALVIRVGQVLYGYYDSAGNPVAGYKAAGVRLDVSAATEQAVNVTATLTSGPGYAHADLVAVAVSKIATYIGGLDIGGTCLMAEITRECMEIPGVVNFVLAGAPADVASSFSVKLMPGTIAVT